MAINLSGGHNNYSGRLLFFTSFGILVYNFLHQFPKVRNLDVEKGQVADVTALGILESFNVKMCMVSSAAEAAEQILRVDDIIKCAPRARARDNRPC